MSDDRKKPLWPWIVALLIGLPVLYVASFGPACWLGSRDIVEISALYRPISAWLPDGELAGPVGWYATLGANAKVQFVVQRGVLYILPEYDWPDIRVRLPTAIGR